MYDLTPFPSYMGQQLINPTLKDYRYRYHREHNYHSNERRGSEHHQQRPSMRQLMGKDIPKRPQTCSPSLLSSSASSNLPPSSSISIVQAQNEKLSEIESVRKLPDYPQRYQR